MLNPFSILSHFSRPESMVRVTNDNCKIECKTKVHAIIYRGLDQTLRFLEFKKQLITLQIAYIWKAWFQTNVYSTKLINNKRPMGHIAHLRKQFKSINTYDYIIALIKRRKNNIIYFMRIYCFFIWRILNLPHPRMLCAKIGWNWLSGSGEEFFLNFVNVFSLFRNYLPLKKGGVLQLKKQ